MKTLETTERMQLTNTMHTMEPTQKITPHLWFDREAKEAADLYTSLFPDSKIKSTTQIHNTPSGSVDVLVIDLMGQEFTLISAGSPFKFNPSISFLVACDREDEVDRLWNSLKEGGRALIELGEYPFARRYVWIEDRYGLSWQLIFREGQDIKQKITPTLMFVGEEWGRAEEAIRFYALVFRNASVGAIDRYGKGEEPDREGTVRHASFMLEGQEFAAMDSALAHDFAFNEAISFIVHCETQDEVDYYWERLSAVPEAEQCGWLKDKFGVSWQIVPRIMDEMLKENDTQRLARVTEAFLKMKKLDIKELERAYRGEAGG